LAKVNVRHEFDLGAVHYLMQDRGGGVAQDMYRRGQNVRTAAIQLAGGDTGRLRASISVDLVPSEGTLAVRVGTNVEYAGVHHEGHGAIVPRRPGGVLVFRPRGGPLVFTKHVRAVEGTEFIKEALPAARD
jgi:phage gpG-like protein